MALPHEPQRKEHRRHDRKTPSMTAAANQYHLIESCETGEGVLSIWHSPGNSDDSWDAFLMKTPLGQFQQSSMWARAKEAEGWDCLRVVATLHDEIVGGFQILVRDTPLGRIGYASKGPVVEPETQNLTELLVVQMRGIARRHKMVCLIVQPPDDSRITSNILGHYRFTEGIPLSIIDTTLLVDVSKGKEALDKGMNRKTRRNVRVANQSGVTIREGTDADIDLFFNLMSDTCERQGVTPNPPTAAALRQLWQTFSKRNCLRTTFAEYNHEVLAGSLNIVFGEKVSLWKKGWNYKYPDKYPNDVLYYELLHWACAHHYAHCDFIAFDRGMAEAIQKGIPLSDAQEKSRHIFNLRFGGVPKILPPARFWVANLFIRFGYENILVRLPHVTRWLVSGIFKTRSGRWQ